MGNNIKLLKVIPISKSGDKILSYFSLKDTKTGDLVTVPVRKKEQLALVLSVEKPEQTKISLKKTGYTLKKIFSVKAENFFLPHFIKSAEKIAEYFHAGTGAVIKELCPTEILKNAEQLNPGKKQTIFRQPSKTEKFLLQASKYERIKFYKNLIRSEFAKKHSVFLCLPSIKEIESYAEKLKKGIEQYTFYFHGKMNAGILKKNWATALKIEHPILIISTGLFFSLPRNDTNVIIVENEGSFLYKSKKRPFLDIRKIAEFLAEENGGKLIFGAEVPRTETYNRALNHELEFAIPTSPKIVSTAQQIIVNMKQEVRGSIISEELKKIIAETNGKDEKIILFINRRGYGLMTFCEDCGQIVLCPNCLAPAVLHKEEKRKFLCHKCFIETEIMDRCADCGGWKIKTLGYGIQKAAEEIVALFPKIKMFRIDSDSTKNSKTTKEIMNGYANTPGSILLATEKMFGFFEGGADRVAVLSIDGLFSLPDFRINEKVFRLLIKLKMRSRKTFLIQTRIPEHPLFENALKGNFKGFYDNELTLRKIFGYPPFKTIMKISIENPGAVLVKKESLALQKYLQEFNPNLLMPFQQKNQKNYIACIILKLPAETWPTGQEKLKNMLHELPLKYKIDIDPESII